MKSGFTNYNPYQLKIHITLNHKQAKINAIERRLDSSFVKWLCICIVNFEYKAKLSKHRKKSVNKKIYNILYRATKRMLENRMFAVIQVKKTD